MQELRKCSDAEEVINVNALRKQIDKLWDKLDEVKTYGMDSPEHEEYLEELYNTIEMLAKKLEDIEEEIENIKDDLIDLKIEL